MMGASRSLDRSGEFSAIQRSRRFSAEVGIASDVSQPCVAIEFPGHACPVHPQVLLVVGDHRIAWVASDPAVDHFPDHVGMSGMPCGVQENGEDHRTQ